MAKVILARPFNGIRGTYKDSDLVYFTLKGRQYGKARGTRSTTSTGEQVKLRSYFTNAQRAWKTLTVAQRDAWQAYAEKHFTQDDEGGTIIPSGHTTYSRANVIRQVLGLAIVSAAPALVDGPPQPASVITQLGAQSPDSVGIEVVHELPVITGHQILVRATAATPSVADKPDSGYRFVRGIGPDSASALLASGGTYGFQPTRFIVNDGERYGVEVRIVRTADGIVSKPMFGDFIKSV